MQLSNLKREIEDGKYAGTWNDKKIIFTVNGRDYSLETGDAAPQSDAPCVINFQAGVPSVEGDYSHPNKVEIE